MTAPLKISPTQVNKYRQCQRIVGFEYVEKRWAPSTVKQQFGTKVHAHLERWLKGAVMPDDSPEGKVAKQGIRVNWLPPPSPELMVEHRFKFEVEPGIVCAGIVDCGVPPDLYDPAPVVIDHKTTSNMRYALTPEALATDPQGLIYSAWAMFYWKAPKVYARWVYYAASNPRSGLRRPAGARPVECAFYAADPRYQNLWSKLLVDMREICRIREKGIKGNDLPANPASCGNYGGCYHSSAKGGPCKLSDVDYLGGLMEAG